MFTGIIETLGTVKSLERKEGNVDMTVEAEFAAELHVDQSIAHNGVCLTVVSITEGAYVVTAIEETLKKSNLGDLKTGDKLNLERCLPLNGRLDGHLVQGHVDQTGTIISIKEQNGSHLFVFSFDQKLKNITVEKGSITINGVSLTVVDSGADSFSTAIIPYSFMHTNFHLLKAGDKVNLEFDIIGKYVGKYLDLYV